MVTIAAYGRLSALFLPWPVACFCPAALQNRMDAHARPRHSMRQGCPLILARSCLPAPRTVEADTGQQPSPHDMDMEVAWKMPHITRAMAKPWPTCTCTCACHARYGTCTHPQSLIAHGTCMPMPVSAQRSSLHTGDESSSLDERDERHTVDSPGAYSPMSILGNTKTLSRAPVRCLGPDH